MTRAPMTNVELEHARGLAVELVVFHEQGHGIPVEVANGRWTGEMLAEVAYAMQQLYERSKLVEPALGEMIADLACALDHWSDQDNPAYKECLAGLLRIAKDVGGIDIAKHLTAFGVDVDGVIKSVKERG